MYLQIMIEFCAGGAVDAIMLGESPLATVGAGRALEALPGTSLVMLLQVYGKAPGGMAEPSPTISKKTCFSELATNHLEPS